MNQRTAYAAEMARLQARLEEKADGKRKAWWERYVKESAPFLGVKMADIRATVHAWYADELAESLAPEAQLDIALALFFGRFTELKLAGTLLLHEVLLPAGVLTCPAGLARLPHLFAPGGIADWNICDWFCVKVLASLIERGGEPCAAQVAAWRDAEDLWQARAAVVAFVPLAGQRGFYPLIERSCRTLIRREERFAKTGVGWILREVSRHDPEFTQRVIQANLPHFSRESLNNAGKYLPEAERQALLGAWRAK